jgi:hypothetical protein
MMLEDMLHNARARTRATEKNMEFTITKEDIAIPDKLSST